MKQLIITFLFLFVLAFSARGQQSPLTDLVVEGKGFAHQGNVLNDKSLVLRARALFERAVSMEPENRIGLYHLGYADYLLARIAFSKKEKDSFNQYIDQAQERTEQLLEKENQWVEVHALLGSIYGMRIANNWINGPLLGPKCQRMMHQAIASDSSNPRLWLVHGISKYNTPTIFGGSIEEAIQALKTSTDLFEHFKSTDPLLPEWGYLDALAWLGRAYEKNNQAQEALVMYKKTLEVEPNFGWVKFNLLPSLEKKITSQ